MKLVKLDDLQPKGIRVTYGKKPPYSELGVTPRTSLQILSLKQLLAKHSGTVEIKFTDDGKGTYNISQILCGTGTGREDALNMLNGFLEIQHIQRAHPDRVLLSVSATEDVLANLPPAHLRLPLHQIGEGGSFLHIHGGGFPTTHATTEHLSRLKNLVGDKNKQASVGIDFIFGDDDKAAIHRIYYPRAAGDIAPYNTLLKLSGEDSFTPELHEERTARLLGNLPMCGRNRE